METTTVDTGKYIVTLEEREGEYFLPGTDIEVYQEDGRWWVQKDETVSVPFEAYMASEQAGKWH